MSKIINHENGQSKMIDGIMKVVNAVETTLGPKGHCVAISGYGVPEITRDGATVAKAITLKDPEEAIGAELIKNAAKKTEDLAGDGTSSTSILTKAIILESIPLLSTKYNINEIKSGMMAASKDFAEYLKTNSIPVDGDLQKIAKVATISANNDPEVGDLIVKCMEAVGENGIITADLSPTLETKVDVVEGMKISRGWANPGFITDPELSRCELNNPLILVVGETIDAVPKILGILNTVVKQKSSILIICDDMADEVLLALVMNKMSGNLNCCVVKGVDFGDSRKNVMEDIACVCGATYICPEYNMKVADSTVAYCGSASKVTVTKDSCLIYSGAGDKDTINTRLQILQTQLENPELREYDKHKILNRISGLAGGIGVIKAGGASETECMNLKATIDDAILASKSAISEGIVCGGGITYIAAGKWMKEKKDQTKPLDWQAGYDVVIKSLSSITKTLAQNSGVSGDVVLEKIYSSDVPNFGYNAKTGEYCDLLEAGVLDSAKVLRVSVENSVSAASMCMLTSCTIVDEVVEEDKK